MIIFLLTFATVALGEITPSSLYGYLPCQDPVTGTAQSPFKFISTYELGTQVSKTDEDSTCMVQAKQT